jgi:hypothetical protein
MVTAQICTIPRNACKSLTTSYAQQKSAQPMTRTQLIRLASDLEPGIHTAVRSPDL